MKKVTLKVPPEAWGTTKTKYPADSNFVQVNELTGSSKNFETSTKGVIKKRGGAISFIVPSRVIKDQYEAIFSDGAHHLLMAGSGTLSYSSGSTETSVTAGYSSIGNFEFSLYQDRVYFGNGIDSPQVYDRGTSYGGVAYVAPKTKVMGAQIPATAPTVAIAAGGSVPLGAHTYKVTYLYYDFEESNGGTASAVVTAAGANQTVDLTALPVGGYGVTARKIYRDDNDGVYRLVGTVANNTATTYSDTASVGTALIPTDNGVPAGFKYIVTHLDRTWISGIPGDPFEVRHSNAGTPDIFATANVLQANPRDYVSGLVVYNDQLVVFSRNSMGIITGRTSDQFRYSEIPTNNIGCIDNRSIQIRVVEGVPLLIWQSDKGFYAFNGSSVEYISDPIEDLVNFNIQQGSQTNGSNTQTTQAHFQGGTATPAIDLTTAPGSVSVATTQKVWDDETDWEGGSSLTNVATNGTGNLQQVPTRNVPAYSSGTLSGTAAVSGSNLVLSVGTGLTGESYTSTVTSFTSESSGNPVTRIGYAFTPTRNGSVTGVQLTALGFRTSGATTYKVKIWASTADAPGAELYSSVDLTAGATSTANFYSINPNHTLSTPVALTSGVTYWFGVQVVATSTFSITNAQGQTFSGTYIRVYRNTTGWGAPSGFSSSGGSSATIGYTFTSSNVPASGVWTSAAYDSKSDSAVAGNITHASTFPSGTSSTTTVEGSNDSTFATGVISQAFSNLNGTSAITLSNKRYWRVKVQVDTTDDRVTATIQPLTLTFSTTSTWISAAIDHTTDITALNTLAMVSSAPVGTTATVTIATSADNVTYSAYSAVGAATPARYSKVKVVLTTDGGNTTTPTVTSVTLTWTTSSTLTSSAIDTGVTPAGWDIFQTQATTNGATVTYQLRSAAASGGLGAASWVTVTNGAFPGASLPLLQWVQYKIAIIATSAQLPTVDSVTINWFVGSAASIRVASIFYNKSYYLAAAAYNSTTNDLLLELEPNGSWRVHRDININAFSYFFNSPYFSSASEARICKFLDSDTHLGAAITMTVDTKAYDFSDDLHTKILRKFYLKCYGTGAVYTPQFSVNNGTTWVGMIDPTTGLASYTTANDGSIVKCRFVPNFGSGSTTAGKSIKFRLTEATTAAAEVAGFEAEVWIRNGELVNG